MRVDERLVVGRGDVLIEKQWASAFHQTDLDAPARSEVDSVVVTGLTTSGCVRATAVDALQYDYRVVLAREAVVIATATPARPTCLTCTPSTPRSGLAEVIALLPGPARVTLRR